MLSTLICDSLISACDLVVCSPARALQEPSTSSLLKSFQIPSFGKQPKLLLRLSLLEESRHFLYRQAGRVQWTLKHFHFAKLEHSNFPRDLLQHVKSRRLILTCSLKMIRQILTLFCFEQCLRY